MKKRFWILIVVAAAGAAAWWGVGRKKAEAPAMSYEAVP